VAQALGLAEQGFDFANALHLTAATDWENFATFDRGFARRARQAGFCGTCFLSHCLDQEAMMSISPKKRWSQHVTEKSDALDLDRACSPGRTPSASRHR
jgi:hypothetical protein